MSKVLRLYMGVTRVIQKRNIYSLMIIVSIPFWRLPIPFSQVIYILCFKEILNHSKKCNITNINVNLDTPLILQQCNIILLIARNENGTWWVSMIVSWKFSRDKSHAIRVIPTNVTHNISFAIIITRTQPKSKI